MSNKLARPAPHTNGHAPVQREGARPSFVSETGYRIHYRYLPLETLPRLEAAAKTALAADQPPMPTQRVEVGPNEWRDEPNPHDTAYQEAMEAWEAAVKQDAGLRFLKLCEDYALIYEIDQEEVAALRAVSAAIGDVLDELSDKQVFLWRIVFPMEEQQLTLYSKLFGGLTEEAIQAQKASFRSKLQEALTENRA